MHPILMDIFTRPVGWLAIGGSLVMVRQFRGRHHVVRVSATDGKVDLLDDDDAPANA